MNEARLLAPLYAAASALPHLSGLVRLVQVGEDERIATAGVTASARMLINPKWFSTLAFREKVFVMAHEIMHLALRSHERCAGTEARLFNVAHDLIINDMLVNALKMDVPANGLYEPGASASSAERIVNEIRRDEASGWPRRRPVWQRQPQAPGALGAALAAAGLGTVQPPEMGGDGDVLDADTERRLFPHAKADPAITAKLAAAGERAVALDVWLRSANSLLAAADAAGANPRSEACTGLWDVLAGYHAPPWEVALQRWFDDVAPSGRTYLRCSRRQGARADVVLPGRAREGWTLNVVLDTSGSMFGTDDSPISRALGSLKSFCISANVGRVRLVQADVDTAADDTVDARDLDRFHIAGGGGSDMSPTMRMLAADPQVEAVIVITDGFIDYPEEAMPYQVLWALTDEPGNFLPAYGRVIVVDTSPSG